MTPAFLSAKREKLCDELYGDIFPIASPSGEQPIQYVVIDFG